MTASFFSRPRTLAIVASLFALPFLGGAGCNPRRACFTFTMDELAKNGNACPAQSKALARFADPSCPGPVTSVDSAGDFEPLAGTTGLCCYTVTDSDTEPLCGVSAGGASGGIGGSGPSTVTVTTGAGGSIGQGCIPCSFLAQGLGTTSMLCSDAIAPANALIQCSCGACFAICQTSLCSAMGAAPECSNCLELQCGPELAACQ